MITTAYGNLLVICQQCAENTSSEHQFCISNKNREQCDVCGRIMPRATYTYDTKELDAARAAREGSCLQR